MKAPRYYTRCEDIPLCKFVEVYKGNLLALVIEGDVDNKTLADAANGLIEEYSVIVGSKNMSFEIDRRSKMINYDIKLIALDVVSNLIDLDRYSDAGQLLRPFGIKIADDYSNIESVRRSIISSRAEINLRVEMLKRQIIDKPKGKTDFVKERMIVSSHFKMYIDPQIYTAAEYGHLVKMMLDELKDMRNGK